MSKYYIVYTNWLAAELRREGFKIVNVKVNNRHPQFDCYSFENSEAFQEALHRITESRKNSHKTRETKETE